MFSRSNRLGRFYTPLEKFVYKSTVIAAIMRIPPVKYLYYTHPYMDILVNKSYLAPALKSAHPPIHGQNDIMESN